MSAPRLYAISRPRRSRGGGVKYLHRGAKILQLDRDFTDSIDTWRRKQPVKLSRRRPAMDLAGLALATKLLKA